MKDSSFSIFPIYTVFQDNQIVDKPEFFIEEFQLLHMESRKKQRNNNLANPSKIKDPGTNHQWMLKQSDEKLKGTL